jgi:2-methylcitrate dehydratase
VLRERLATPRPLTRITETFMKRWPVGSLAQSAIQAALSARQKVSDPARIKQVRVFVEEGAYEHLVKIRSAPYAPISRETADHSLPYVVAAAVLDGYVGTDSFAPSRVLEPERRRFVADKVKAAPAPELGTIAGGKHKRAEAGYLGRVEIELSDGTVVHGDAKPFPGHPKNPFTDEDLAAKLEENMEPFAGSARTAKLTTCLASIETLARVRDLTALLALPDSSGVDSARTE